MDGDDGELSVKFRYTPEVWQAVRRIMRPQQSAAIKLPDETPAGAKMAA